MKVIRLQTLLLLLLIPFYVSAQPEGIPAERLKFQVLTIDDGLSQGLVTEIAQDKHGFLWFGTKDGLNKYDGYGFKIYRPNANDSTSLAGNHIVNMLVDVRGLLWIFFSNGKIDVFNPETEIAFHFREAEEKVNLKEWWQFRFMQKTDGTVFYSDAISYVKLETVADAGSRFGYRFKIHDLTSRLPERTKAGWVNSFISSGNELYFSLNDSVYIYSDADLSLPVEVKKYHYTKFSQAQAPVFLIKEDTVRHRLMSLGKSCFTLYDMRSGMKTDSITLGKYYKGNYFLDFDFDYKGRIWIASANDLFLYDPETKIMKRLLAQDANVKDVMLTGVSSVFNDRSGVTWLGTGGYGLIKYNPAVERFHHVSGAGSVQGIWEDNDRERIWFGRSDETMAFYDRRNSGITDLVIREKDAGGRAVAKKFFGRAFCVDENGYWVQNGIRLCYIDRDMNVRKKIVPQKVNYVYEGKSVKDSKGNVWIASGISKGFVLYKLNENSESEVASYGFPVQESYSLYPFTSALVTDAHDNLWIGTVEGLFFFNTEKETWTHYVHKENDSTTLPMSTIFSLCNDEDSENILWVGTNGGGLTGFDKNTGHCITYTTDAGLPNNVIYGILADGSGNLWLSTNNGIARFNPQTKAVKTFTVKDGLQSNEFNRYASCKLASGELVFGGVNGFNIFNPAEINENSFQPNILFTRFKIGNNEVPLSAEGVLTKNIFAAKEINLNYTQNFITFGFASTDYSAPDNITYQYQLEGLDDDWLPTTRLNEATYTNLNPGTYTFKVRGTNSDGAWSANEAAIGIFISPPWWGTWWFRGLVVLMVAAAIYSFYRYRLTQAVKLMSLRDRIASDLHDEIGSTLSSISLYSEAAKKMLNGNEQADKVLTKINSNTSQMMEAMSDIVWAINTRNDKLDNLVNRMRGFAVQVSEAGKFQLHLADNKDLPDMPLDMYERKNLYLIYKEAVNNAAKYAACKNIWIEFSNKNNVLQMKIKDDGKGFDQSGTSVLIKGKGGGNGLFNMKKRADDLRGELLVISEEGKGTEILLRMKLKKS